MQSYGCPIRVFTVFYACSPPPQLEHRPSSSLDQASGCTGPISWSIPFWRSLLCDVIHPRSRFRHVWDLLMSLILISWVSIILPYIVCFDIPCDLPSALGMIIDGQHLNNDLNFPILEINKTPTIDFPEVRYINGRLTLVKLSLSKSEIHHGPTPRSKFR